MPKVSEMEQAVEQLSEPQLARFRRWFAEYDANVWDEQIEADAAAGKFDALSKDALAESQPFNEQGAH